MSTNPTKSGKVVETKHRYRDQVDLPNGARIWPTYWARSPHWNAESPMIGFIDQIATRERAELIVTAVNAFDANQAEIKRLREALTCDGNDVRTYTLLDWCADRLTHVADGNLEFLGSDESQRQLISMLRSKGATARAALAEKGE